MANHTPVTRTEAQELQRQINFNKTLRMRAREKAEQKINEYNEKILRLEERLAEIS